MKDCNTCEDTSTDGLESGLKSLINAQLLFGKEVLKLLGGAGRAAGSMASGIGLPKGSSCCDIPEPCWMPLSLGEVKCVLRPGDTGTVCLVVSNGDFRPHAYQFAATGKSAAHVGFSTASVTLGPKERIAVTATLTVPKEGKDGEDCRCIDHEVLIWVRGCRNHYLRWTVDELASSKPCCHEVVVNDDPDYVLHWYDHFYVTRPCFGAATLPGPNTGVVGVVR
jgi:hypothetical protein